MGAAFGLCTAYCEAMDCDTVDPEGTTKACARVSAKFNDITGRSLPCQVSLCPCAAEDWWNDFLESGPWNTCDVLNTALFKDMRRLLESGTANNAHSPSPDLTGETL